MELWISKDETLERDILEQEEIIRNAQKIIEQKRFEQLVNSVHIDGCRLYKATNRLTTYRFIEDFHELKKYRVVMYPIYLERKCYYPSWAKNIYACTFASFNIVDNKKDYNELIDAISVSMGNSQLEAERFVKKYKITVPVTTRTDYEDNNIVIDWSKGKRLAHNDPNLIEHNSVENVVKIKYILILSCEIL